MQIFCGGWSWNWIRQDNGQHTVIDGWQHAEVRNWWQSNEAALTYLLKEHRVSGEW